MTLGDEETGEEEGCEEEVSCCAKAIGGSSVEEPPGYGYRACVLAIHQATRQPSRLNMKSRKRLQPVRICPAPRPPSGGIQDEP